MNKKAKKIELIIPFFNGNFLILNKGVYDGFKNESGEFYYITHIFGWYVVPNDWIKE